MGRFRWPTAIFGIVCALLMVVTSLLWRPDANARALAQAPAPTPTAAPVPVYYNYSVPFVCGVQKLGETGEPPVKPGNYATTIKIHNYNYRRVGVRKKLLVTIDKGQVVGREPSQVGPRAYDTIYLGNDFATMDDCNKIWQLLNPAGTALPSPMPLMSGYLVVISQLDVDVDAIYTAEVPGMSTTQTGTGISQDVERIAGKRVAIPNQLFPGGVLK